MIRILPFKIAITKLSDNLYLGSIEDAFNLKKLKSLNITHVLNVTTEIPNFYEGSFVYKKINAKDAPKFQLSKYFDEIADFIHEGTTKGKILVHCYCGISRSTTSILAYLIKYKNQDIESSLKYIRKKRWIICPNDGFIRQLKVYQSENLKPDQKENVPKKQSEFRFTIKFQKPLKVGKEEPAKKAETLQSIPKSENAHRPNVFTIKQSSTNIRLAGSVKPNTRNLTISPFQ